MDDVKRKDLVFEFIRTGGPGGQHRNKAFSGVRLIHLPTGIVVRATERRSQMANRRVALDRLRACLIARSVVKKERKVTVVPVSVRGRRMDAKRRRGNRKSERRRGRYLVV